VGSCAVAAHRSARLLSTTSHLSGGKIPHRRLHAATLARVRWPPGFPSMLCPVFGTARYHSACRLCARPQAVPSPSAPLLRLQPTLHRHASLAAAHCTVAMLGQALTDKAPTACHRWSSPAACTPRHRAVALAPRRLPCTRCHMACLIRRVTAAAQHLGHLTTGHPRADKAAHARVRSSCRCPLIASTAAAAHARVRLPRCLSPELARRSVL
jgi:hypothetical protein